MKFVKTIKDFFICKKVEKALGIKLTKWQKNFIFNGKPIPYEIHRNRGNGKTLAHILKLLLSKWNPVIVAKFILNEYDIAGRNLEYYSVGWMGDDSQNLGRQNFFNEWLYDVDAKLTQAGVNTREMLYRGKNNYEDYQNS